MCWSVTRRPFDPLLADARFAVDAVDATADAGP